ncbi:histidine kinase, partial [Streptomyces sp. NPDC006553]
GRPQASRPPAQAGPPAPTLGGGAPGGPVPAPRRTAPQPPGTARPGILPRETGSARPPVPPQAPASPRPQSLPRPTAVPALAAPPEPGPPPAGVTELRRRGPSVPPPTRQQQPGTPAGATGPAGAARHAGHGNDAEGELPRRVRQASLVPQLREAPASPPVFVPAEEDTDARTPEAVRDRMAAYRDGWQRGGGAAPGSRRPLGTGTGHEPGHGTTPLDDPRPEGDQP